MKTQTDYETIPTLAVFALTEDAEIAALRLRAVGIPNDAIRQARLMPGTYVCSDLSLGEEVAGVVRGAELGLAAGGALGLGLAVAIGGTGLAAYAGLAAGGGVIGALLGSIIGAAVSAHYDDDVADSIHVSEADADSVVVLIAWTHAHGPTDRARRALKGLHVLAFLDPELYLQNELMDAPTGLP